MYDSTRDTQEHIKLVQIGLANIIRQLTYRMIEHDQSKYEKPEKSIFDKYTPLLGGTTYGSEEYRGYLKEMDVAIKHHYSCNSHHPEYYENGIKGMTLLDLLEMLIDWNAATLRHADGDIMRSIDINQGRFGYTDELKQILINTLRILK